MAKSSRTYVPELSKVSEGTEPIENPNELFEKLEEKYGLERAFQLVEKNTKSGILNTEKLSGKLEKEYSRDPSPVIPYAALPANSARGSNGRNPATLGSLKELSYPDQVFKRLEEALQDPRRTARIFEQNTTDGKLDTSKLYENLEKFLSPKALEKVFFGDKKPINDISESTYQSTGTLKRLQKDGLVTNSLIGSNEDRSSSASSQRSTSPNNEENRPQQRTAPSLPAGKIGNQEEYLSRVYANVEKKLGSELTADLLSNGRGGAPLNLKQVQETLKIVLPQKDVFKIFEDSLEPNGKNSSQRNQPNALGNELKSLDRAFIGDASNANGQTARAASQPSIIQKNLLDDRPRDREGLGR
jgi:hypothetical protein